MPENPWAYHEARERIREKKENEIVTVEKQKEEFEKSKNILRKKRWLDVHELKRRIETGNSLDLLKSEIRNALSEWVITRDTYDKVIASIDNDTTKEDIDSGMIDPNRLPFSQNELAKFLENQKLWDNIWADIVWFLYGFVIQGSAVMVIIAWKILVDLLFLPRDIYTHFTQK